MGFTLPVVLMLLLLTLYGLLIVALARLRNWLSPSIGSRRRWLPRR